MDATLGTGTYQIVLVGGGLSSYLASTDSSTNQPLWNSNDDQTLATFPIVQSGRN